MVTEDMATPGQVAANEVARQAVMMVFGLVTAVILLKIQSKMIQKMMPAGPPGSAAAADAQRTQRMTEAKRLEKGWSRIAGWFADLSVWASRQANEAHASYERDRA